MISWSQACYLAAQAEIEAAIRLRGREGRLERHAAGMRAERILQASGRRRNLPPELLVKVQFQLERKS